MYLNLNTAASKTKYNQTSSILLPNITKKNKISLIVCCVIFKIIIYSLFCSLCLTSWAYILAFWFMNIQWSNPAAGLLSLHDEVHIWHQSLSLRRITVDDRLNHEPWCSHLPVRLCKSAPYGHRGELLRSWGVELFSVWRLPRVLNGRGDSVSVLWGGEGHGSHPAFACPQLSWCSACTSALEETLLGGGGGCHHKGRCRSHDREMFGILATAQTNVKTMRIFRQATCSVCWIPPACLSSLSARLLGGARSSGRWPSGFLRERSAPWSSSRDTSSGSDRRAAMCRGESPGALWFTPAPEGERRRRRFDSLTLQNCRRASLTVHFMLLVSSKEHGISLLFILKTWWCFLIKLNSLRSWIIKEIRPKNDWFYLKQSTTWILIA